jgi:hypothetical protein
MRFHFDPAKFRDFPVYTLPFPAVAYEIYRELEVSHKDNLPTRQLGRMLRILYPALIGTFYRGDPAIAIQRTGYPPLPPIERLRHVVLEWFGLWLESIRPSNQPLSTQRQLDLKNRLAQSLHNWDWQPQENYLNDSLVYRVLPSLLSVLLAERSDDWQGNFDGQSGLAWNLAQFSLDHGLGLVSAVCTGPRESAYAYRLEFAAATYSGQSEPNTVNLYLQCQRYASATENSPVRLNHRRAATVLFRLGEASKPEYEEYLTSAMIPLSLAWRAGKFEWQDKLPEILAKLHLRQIVSADDIVKSPQVHLSMRNGDEYRLLYAEGMRPNHGMETGLSMGARRDAMQMVATLLDDYLTPNKAIQEISQFIGAQLPKVLRRDPTDTDKSRMRHNQALRYALDLKENEFAHVLICYRNEVTRQLLRAELSETFGYDNANIQPQALKVYDCQILDLGLHEAIPDPTHKPTVTQRRQAWRKWLENQLNAFRLTPREQPVFALIENLTEENGGNRLQPAVEPLKGIIRAACYDLGIASQIVLQPSIDATWKDENGKRTSDGNRAKSAVADLLFRQSGLTFSTDERPGALYGKILSEAEQAKSQGMFVAENLRVIGIAHYRKRNPNIDIPMAVCLEPDGRVTARLIGTSEWKPYFRTVLELGKRLVRHSARREGLCLNSGELLQFLSEIVDSSESDQHHTLILVNKVNWRNVWKQLQSGNMRKDLLEIGDLSITPHRSKNLRVVSLRPRVSNYETPLYIGLASADWRHGDISEEIEIEEADTELPLESAPDASDAADSLVLMPRRKVPTIFLDDVASAQGFPTYGGIACVPPTSPQEMRKSSSLTEPQAGRGGQIAFKHQTIVYAEPFFLQAWQGDKPEDWAFLTHILRSLPSWTEDAHLLMPFPLHLAEAAFEDAYDALQALNGLSSDGDEEED